VSSRASYDYSSSTEDIVTPEVGDYDAVRRRDETRVTTLIRRLADEVTTLFTKELALLKVETTSAINDTRAGIASLAAGGAVLYAGFLFLLTAAVLGLAEVMEPWLAALIVGAVVAIIGAIMLSSGKKKLAPSAFNPTHTRSSLEKDRDMIKRNINESHER
jgi:uncharacterized membrane protein YqjE